MQDFDAIVGDVGAIAELLQNARRLLVDWIAMASSSRSGMRRASAPSSAGADGAFFLLDDAERTADCVEELRGRMGLCTILRCPCWRRAPSPRSHMEESSSSGMVCGCAGGFFGERQTIRFGQLQVQNRHVKCRVRDSFTASVVCGALDFHSHAARCLMMHRLVGLFDHKQGQGELEQNLPVRRLVEADRATTMK